MEEVETITDEIVNASYTNAFNLLIGNTDFDTLADQEEFYLPKDYDDPKIVLQYFEDIEDYEKCVEIRDLKFSFDYVLNSLKDAIKQIKHEK